MIDRLHQQLRDQADRAFDGSAVKTVYCVAVIGPHWRSSRKNDDGQDLLHITDWHDTTHDIASFHDFQNLKNLIDSL